MVKIMAQCEAFDCYRQSHSMHIFFYHSYNGTHRTKWLLRQGPPLYRRYCHLASAVYRASAYFTIGIGALRKQHHCTPCLLRCCNVFQVWIESVSVLWPGSGSSDTINIASITINTLDIKHYTQPWPRHYNVEVTSFLTRAEKCMWSIQHKACNKNSYTRRIHLRALLFGYS